ncbi:transposase [Streptomyces mirabilis]|uniref:transposase n=1 Tax=Streptomyces mirabilis TaxID=68239 RepID=UPI0036A025E4
MDSAVGEVAAMVMGSWPGRTIPPLTVRMARVSNPRGTAAMGVRDRLDGQFTDEDFVGWYPVDGRRGLSPAQLALVSVMQFAENLTDWQAAEVVRCRLCWKYCQDLELANPGFVHSVLSDFRDRMAEEDRVDQLVTVMVDRLVVAGLLRRRAQLRTDSTHMVAAVRRLNRGKPVAETLRCALEELTVHAEDWLAERVTPAWASVMAGRCVATGCRVAARR